MKKKHARYSPSTLENLTLCPCFAYPEGDNEAAEEGTLLHKALETGNDSGLDEGQCGLVQAARDYISNIKAALPPGHEDHAEMEVRLEDLTYGTADRVLIAPPTAHLFDAKFGRKGATDAENNMQIRTYSAALLNIRPDLESITAHIMAPRAHDFTSATFTRDIIPAMCAEITALYEMLDDPFERKPRANGDLCGICARASKCPEVSKAVVSTARGLGLPVPEVFKPEALVSTRDRGIAQLIAGVLENWAEQVRKYNLDFVRAGGEIPGFIKRTRSSGVRVPRENTLTAFDTIRDTGFLSERDILSGMTLSVSELANVAAGVRGTKAAEEKIRLQELLGELGVESTIIYLQKDKKQKIL